MNLKGARYLAIVVSLIVLSACAPARLAKRAEAPPSPETIQALRQFEKAEALSKKRAYSEAVAIYQDYLRRYPKGALVDTALMKSGAIHIAMGDYLRARQALENLISKYPKSRFVQDARFEAALSYHREGDFKSALDYGKSALELAQTDLQRLRLHSLMGDSYKASKQYSNAVTSYMAAYKKAPELERLKILAKVKDAITYLEESELAHLLEIYKDRAPGGYLLLQLAGKYEQAGRIESAMQVLADFIARFPDHDEFKTGIALMEDLRSRSMVDMFSIGCVLPLSGPYAAVGNRALSGIELAVNRFNTRSHAPPIQLHIRDSKGDPNEAVIAVEDLALNFGVSAIIGPMITSESAALKAQALKVPIITLTQKPDITKLGDCVFRNFLIVSLQIKAILDYAVNDLGIKKFAILYPDERYGISFMNRFWDELLKRGAEVVGIEAYSPTQTDFTDSIKKLVGLYYPRPEEPVQEGLGGLKALLDFLPPELSADSSFVPGVERGTPQPPIPLESMALADEAAPQTDQPTEPEEEPLEPIIDFDAIFIPDSFEKVGLITPQILYNDVTDILLLGTNLWHSDELIEMARDYIQGAVVPDGFFVNSPSANVRDFVRSFKKIFLADPGFLEAQAYDAATILFEVVSQPHVRSRGTLKSGLHEVRDFPGITGLTSFDETGDVAKQLYLLKVKRGHFIQIKP